MSLENVSVIDLWYQSAIKGKMIDENIFLDKFKEECPKTISAVFERNCNFQCKHCFYQKENASYLENDKYEIGGILQNLVQQVGQGCYLLHAGRVLREWHIPILRNIQNTNPGIKIGLIDNGSYVKLIDKINSFNLFFDWIDISLDGTLEVHNKQRNNSTAFKTACNGLSKTRSILEKEGRLTVLFTLTTINFYSIKETIDFALEYADEFHLSPISPRKGQQYLVPSLPEVGKMWDSITTTHKTHKGKIVIRIYNASDFKKLAQVIGHKTISQSFNSALVMPDTVGVLLNIEEISVFFFPSSLWPKEEILVDTDGSYRIGYSGQFTLPELHSGYSRSGENILSYTISKLDKMSNLNDLYQECVKTWWGLLGKSKFHQEIETFQTIIKGGN